jgi:molybdate transport system substrate-binding protein
MYHGLSRMTLSSIRDYCTLAACLLCAACSPANGPRKLTVAAAADLQFALPEVIREFHAANQGTEVSVVYGSSGNFYSQIRNGAPFDVFLSADANYPRQLAAGGFAAPGSLFSYAAGQIALWVPVRSPLDVEHRGIRVLEDASVKHVAIANPQHAPYGRAAEAALRSLGVYDAVAPKIVMGENIAQTLEFVQSGAADAGIVALSLALAPSVRAQGRYWEIPPSAYPRIEQAGAILARARGSKTAARFREFLLSAKGKQILRGFGFSVPGGG